MTTKQNNFEGGGAAGGEGTAITTGNSGGGSGDALATITLPGTATSATFNYSATGMNPSGTFGGRFQITGATVGGWRAYLAWTAAGTTLAGRFTFCLNTLPTVNCNIAGIINGSFTGNVRLLYLTASQSVQTTNAAGTGIGSTSGTLSAGTVYVWEMQIDCAASNTTGTINSQLYALSAPGSLLINFASSTADAGGGAASPQPIRGSAGNNDLVANLDVTFDDLLFVTGTTTPVGPPNVGATITMGSALAAAAAQTAPQVMNLTSPAYAATATDLGGGPGSWVNVTNAQGAADGSFATWTSP